MCTERPGSSNKTSSPQQLQSSISHIELFPVPAPSLLMTTQQSGASYYLRRGPYLQALLQLGVIHRTVNNSLQIAKSCFAVCYCGESDGEVIIIAVLQEIPMKFLR